MASVFKLRGSVTVVILPGSNKNKVIFVSLGLLNIFYRYKVSKDLENIDKQGSL